MVGSTDNNIVVLYRVFIHHIALNYCSVIFIPILDVATMLLKACKDTHQRSGASPAQLYAGFNMVCDTFPGRSRGQASHRRKNAARIRSGPRLAAQPQLPDPSERQTARRVRANNGPPHRSFASLFPPQGAALYPCQGIKLRLAPYLATVAV